LLAGERFQSGMHGGLPGRPPGGWRMMAQRADSLTEDGGVVWIDHGLHREDSRMAAKRRHRPVDHGLAANRSILLRSPCAGTQAATGCDNDGGSPLRFRHTTQLKDWWTIGRLHCPYHDEVRKPARFIMIVGKAYFVALHLKDSKNCLNCRHEA